MTTESPQQRMVEELEVIAERARRTLADPKKARWHRAENELLVRVELELARLRVTAGGRA